MINFLRLFLPYLLSLVGIVVFILIAAWVAKSIFKSREDYKEAHSIIKKIEIFLFVAVLSIFSYKAVDIASVNEIPRAALNKDGMQDMKNGFKDRIDSIQKATQKPDTSKKQSSKQ